MKLKVLLWLVLFANFGWAQEIQHVKIKDYKVTTLADSLRESSGLEFYNYQLLSFNDSGHSGDLFLLNTTSGKIERTIETQLPNTDWEAITKDSTSIYIGDFGNNGGARKDLKIFKLPYRDSTFIADSTKVISFHYPEQKDFIFNNLNTDFDAEAMVFYNQKLQVFTKEWQSRSVTRYELDPNDFTLQSAQKIESYKTGFVVTDAAYFDKKLFLVGYTKLTQVYLMIFNESHNHLFFSNKPRKYHLGSALSIGQIEGIAVDDKGIYLSSEFFKTPIKTVKQSLYFIPKEKIEY